MTTQVLDLLDDEQNVPSADWTTEVMAQRFPDNKHALRAGAHLASVRSSIVQLYLDKQVFDDVERATGLRIRTRFTSKADLVIHPASPTDDAVKLAPVHRIDDQDLCAVQQALQHIEFPAVVAFDRTIRIFSYGPWGRSTLRACELAISPNMTNPYEAITVAEHLLAAGVPANVALSRTVLLSFTAPMVSSRRLDQAAARLSRLSDDSNSDQISLALR